MPIQSEALKAGITFTGQKCVPVALSVFALSGVVSGAARAEDGQSVLKKVEAAYSSAKSYQGTMTVHQTGTTPDKKPASRTTVQVLKYKTPSMFMMQTKISVTGGPKGSQQAERSIISDGKVVFVYLQAEKQYIKQQLPAPVALPKLISVIPGSNITDVKMLPQKTVQGHAAYVVQFMPAIPPTATPEQKKQFLAAVKPLQITVDKQNYHILGLQQHNGASALDVVFSGQSFNSPIADSVFHFTPPAGAKEARPPQGGAPGGAPGLPGGPPR